jgi:tetratricopeptide (TPR) repeat protein
MTDPIGWISLAGGPVIRGVKWLLLEARVVRKVRSELNTAGYRIDSIALRRVMYEPGFAERLALLPRDGDELDQALAGVIDPNDVDGVGLLRERLTRAFAVRLPGSTRTSQFSEDRAASRQQEIIETIELVRQGIDSGARDDTVFEYRLTEMHPTRARAFRQLREVWPATAEVVGALATSADRVALLHRWASNPPRALTDGPSDLLGVISDVAADLPEVTDQELAISFIERALEKDIEPRGYWLIRLMTLRGITDVERATEYLAEVSDYPLVVASLHPDGPEQAIVTLEGWRAPSRREEIHRRVLLVHYYQATGRIDDAITLAKATATEFDSTAAALLAVQALMARHMMARNAGHRSDLSSALVLVVDTRAKRRRWGLESGQALASEIRVRRLLADHRGALDIANGVGEVPATPEELRHPAVIAESALVHARRGDLEIAKRLVSDAPASERPHIEAVIADREDRTDDAIRFWQSAIDANQEWGEKTDLALQLAFHGVRSPFLDRLREANANVADEISKVAALYSHEPGALEAFRGFANAEHRGAQFLYNYFRREGDEAAAAAVAADAAVRWGDPDLWIESARYQLRQRQFATTIEQVHAAFVVAGEGWGGRRLAYGLLVEAQTAAGDWQRAMNSAAQMVADDPGDTSAVWALAYCQMKLNDYGAARKTWLAAGGPEPETEVEVVAWIELVRTYGSGVGTARDALKVAARYPDNEAIRAALVGALFTGPRDATSGEGDQEDVASDVVEELDPDTAAFRELLSDYLRDYPEGAIRQVEVDPEDPLRSLQGLLGEGRPHPELAQRISNGALPYGFASEVAGRTYLEGLITRSTGPVFTGPPNADSEAAAFEAAHDRGVILDLSALVTNARLPEPLRVQLTGHFANARALTDQQSDAVDGARVISRDSGLSLHPGEDGALPSVEHRTSEEIAAASAIAESVVQTFNRLGLDSHPQITAIEQLAELDFRGSFLLAADHAVGANLPLWSDDRALGSLARVTGGHAFDTPALLRHLRVEGVIEEELLDLADATLVAAGYTGVDFSPTVWELAITLAPTPAGVIQAIKYGNGDAVQERAGFAMAQIDANVGDPMVLAGYVHALAQWLVHIAADEETVATNLQVLARNLLRRVWMTSSTLPYCVDAFRATSSEVAVSVLLHQVYFGFEALAVRTDDATAAVATFELVSRLSPPDASRVRAAIVARSFE